MKKLKCLVAFTLLIQPHWGMANPGDGWVFIGVDSMDAGAKVYVKEDRVSDLGNRNILVPSFTVHDVTLRGIEMQGPDGTWYNTQYPHRSLLTWGVYDCQRRMIATYEWHYFSGTRPSSETLVYMEKDESPFFIPEIGEDPVMRYACE